MEPAERISVLIADDHALIREGIRKVLEFETDIEVVAEAGVSDEAIARAREFRPDIALIDINMPGVGGIGVIAAIKKENPGVEVVVLTVHDDDRHVIDAIKAGAKGYVLKDMESGELARAIRTVRNGCYSIRPNLLTKVMEEFLRMSRDLLEMIEATGSTMYEGVTTLTEREEQILGLVARGNTNKAIARELFISEQTVKNHVSSILRKLGLKKRTQMSLYALGGWGRAKGCQDSTKVLFKNPPFGRLY